MISANHRPAAVASLVFLIMLVAEIAAIVLLNHGHFAYVIDDPYIHLALSERIAHGHYGLNPDETVAPSSSILWPFLLAPFAWFEWHALVPLAFCSLAAVAALFAAGRLLSEISVSASPIPSARSAILLIALIFVLAMPLHALSGMEHLPHVAVTAIAAVGLIILVTRSEPPWWLYIALLLSPALRYEGVSILLAGTAALALNGRPRSAAATLVAGLLPFVIFGSFLMSNGLPPIPSSLLVKSPVHSTNFTGAVVSILQVVQTNLLFERTGLVLALLTVICVLKAPRPQGEGILAWAVCLVTGIYFVEGYPVTLGRYSLFVSTFAIFIAVFLWRRELARFAGRSGPFQFAAATAVAVMLFNPAQIKLMAVAPIMANNNWQQQHQLARFLIEFWRRPAAFTELGRMSYENSNYVLDLWGLGSEEARTLRLNHAPDWLNQITRERNIGLALIYDDWFEGLIPHHWRRVGVLEISRTNMVLPSPRISIYATSSAEVEDIESALMAFEPTLPAGTNLVFEEVNRKAYARKSSRCGTTAPLVNCSVE